MVVRIDKRRRRREGIGDIDSVHHHHHHGSSREHRYRRRRSRNRHHDDDGCGEDKMHSIIIAGVSRLERAAYRYLNFFDFVDAI